MYEFFTFNFAGDWKTLTIDYEKLYRFLPVAPKKYLSEIEQQLGKALHQLVETGVLAEAKWQPGKRGQPQLVVRRGRLLAKRGLRSASIGDVGDFEATDIQDLYRQVRPEDELVCQFHSLWDGSDHYHPTAADRARAQEVLAAYGPKQAEKLLPLVVELLREHFPSAKSFGATARYWTDAAKDHQHKQAAVDRRKQEFIDGQLEEERRRQKQADQQRRQEQWDQLSAEEQEDVERRVLETHSASLHLDSHPRILHQFCLKELGE